MQLSGGDGGDDWEEGGAVGRAHDANAESGAERGVRNIGPVVQEFWRFVRPVRERDFGHSGVGRAYRVG